jgi:hypothetical protein
MATPVNMRLNNFSWGIGGKSRNRELLSVKGKAMVSIQGSKISEIEGEQPSYPFSLHHRENTAIYKAGILGRGASEYLPGVLLQQFIDMNVSDGRSGKEVSAGFFRNRLASLLGKHSYDFKEYEIGNNERIPSRIHALGNLNGS